MTFRFRCAAAFVAVLSSAPAFAQAQRGAWTTSHASPQAAPSRGWRDVNGLSVRAAEGEQTYVLTKTVSRETETFAAADPTVAAAQDVGIAVGFNMQRVLAVGLNA